MSHITRINYLYFSGLLFLLLYWLFGYDGITFSDDVTYLYYGHIFWSGIDISDSYHFADRWGAYLVSGFFTWLLGYSDRWGSLAALLSYMLTYTLLFQLMHTFKQQVVFVVLFLTQVYFMHFLGKVYPDGQLILWVALVPLAAVYRTKRPIVMALLTSLAFIVGFSTKETMVFLLPFPFILFGLDTYQKKDLSFYWYFAGFSTVILLLYFGYYHFAHGDFLHRLHSVNAGHYISEYTYHDKGWGAILKRVSFQPFFTFVSRSYWLMLVIAIPGTYLGLTKHAKIGLEFGIAFICLLVGFWFMSSTLDFYNPIYLNPRHLIILIPILAVLGAYAAESLTDWRELIAFLLLLGAVLAGFQKEWLMLGYLVLAAALTFGYKQKMVFHLAILGLMVLPVLWAANYQYQLKNYKYLKTVLAKETQAIAESEIVMVNNFVHSSSAILLEEFGFSHPNLISWEEWPRIAKEKPKYFTRIVYAYYYHAYPQEETDRDLFEAWLEVSDYHLVDQRTSRWIKIERFELK
jgi:hypothetical protein